jgi:two-component system alkaline phosphatase synthesis response regulator PhoP
MNEPKDLMRYGSASKPKPSKRRVHLLEDEPLLRSTLKLALEQMDLEVDEVSTLRESKEALKLNAYDLLIFDRVLPDGDGITRCSELRAQGYLGMILILTALGNPKDRVFGLHSGADDYLAKPFDLEELKARVTALLRRIPTQVLLPTTLSTPPEIWKLNEDTLSILGPHGWKQLTVLEFKLAKRLMEARGAIISRATLLREVWGFQLLPQTRTVDHFLGRLRKYFELNPEQPVHFLTVRGAGYQFVTATSPGGDQNQQVD